MIIGVAEAKRLVGETNTSMSSQEFCDKYGAIPLDNNVRHSGKPLYLFDSEQIEQIAFRLHHKEGKLTNEETLTYLVTSVTAIEKKLDVLLEAFRAQPTDLFGDVISHDH